jgi:hypothetical protein
LVFLGEVPLGEYGWDTFHLISNQFFMYMDFLNQALLALWIIFPRRFNSYFFPSLFILVKVHDTESSSSELFDVIVLHSIDHNVFFVAFFVGIVE